MNHDRLRIRQWERLTYNDPKRDLMALALLNDAVVGSPLSHNEKQLRTHSQRSLLERRQAALFAWGLVNLYAFESLEYALIDAEGHDAIFRWINADAVCYRPVQLKEVVSESRNKLGDLQNVIDSLSKYRNAGDLTVAIHVNRRMAGHITLELSANLTIGQLFIFGGCSPDQQRWFIQGDFIKTLERAEFDYPLPGPEFSL